MENILQREALLSRVKPMAKDHASVPDQEFTALVERRSRFVFRVAYAVLRNAHDAEDVVQETFLKLYRSAAWRDMRDEPGFLARTAWRVAVGRMRKTSDLAPEEMASPDRNPEAAAIDADWNAIVH